MREVLDGLEEMACYISYQAIDESFEILSIDPPPEDDPVRLADRASIHCISHAAKMKAAQEEGSTTAREEARKTKLAETRSLRKERNARAQRNDIANYLIAREQRLIQN